MECTCFLVKPDAYAQREVILQHIRRNQFFVIESKEVHFSQVLAAQFYAPLHADPQYEALVAFLCSGPTLALQLSKVRAVRVLGLLVGPSDPDKARAEAPGALRAIFGTDPIRNAVHSSANPQEAKRELGVLFPAASAKQLDTQGYLQRALLPSLVDGLSSICRSKGADPHQLLQQWLRMNGPAPEPNYPRAILPGHLLYQDRIRDIDALETSKSMPGAWNFRRSKEGPQVWGSGQCDGPGLTQVVEELTTAGCETVVVWSLREEPVVYVRDTPFGLRQADRVEYAIPDLCTHDSAVLQSMGHRLVEDILEESAASGQVEAWLQVERDRGERAPIVKYNFEDLAEADVRTLSEKCQDVYEETGVDVVVQYCPIPRFGLWTSYDLVTLCRTLKEVHSQKVGHLFQCQTGICRTALAMTLAHAVLQLIHNPIALPKGLPIDESSPSLQAGEWKAVQALCKLLPNGYSLKALLDTSIDSCDTAFNLRDAILDCRNNSQEPNKHLKANTPSSWAARFPDIDRGVDFWIQYALVFLERYCTLLLCLAWVHEALPTNFSISYGQWINQRPHLLWPLKELQLI